jgi:hypothetical protein
VASLAFHVDGLGATEQLLLQPTMATTRCQFGSHQLYHKSRLYGVTWRLNDCAVRASLELCSLLSEVTVCYGRRPPPARARAHINIHTLANRSRADFNPIATMRVPCCLQVVWICTGGTEEPMRQMTSSRAPHSIWLQQQGAVHFTWPWPQDRVQHIFTHPWSSALCACWEFALLCKAVALQ